MKKKIFLDELFNFSYQGQLVEQTYSVSSPCWSDIHNFHCQRWSPSWNWHFQGWNISPQPAMLKYVPDSLPVLFPERRKIKTIHVKNNFSILFCSALTFFFRLVVKSWSCKQFLMRRNLILCLANRINLYYFCLLSRRLPNVFQFLDNFDFQIKY